MTGKRPLTEDERNALLSHLDKVGKVRDHLFVLAGLYTGFRAHELPAIQVKHFSAGGHLAPEISLPRRSLKFGKGKMARSICGRRVPIHPVLRDALENYWLKHMRSPLDPESYLFASETRRWKPISVLQAWKIFKQALVAAGIHDPNLGLHSLRKGFAASVHKAAGNDLMKTMRILGHKNPLTTLRYLESSREDLDQVVLGLNFNGRVSGGTAQCIGESCDSTRVI